MFKVLKGTGDARGQNQFTNVILFKNNSQLCWGTHLAWSLNSEFNRVKITSVFEKSFRCFPLRATSESESNAHAHRLPGFVE